MKRLLLLGLAAFLASSAASAPMNPAQMKWGPAPPGLPAGAQATVLSGDPTKEGMFTIRLKFPAGYRVMPHHHPTPELVTVIQGQMSLGMGSAFVPRRASNLIQGGYVALPADMNHFASTRAGATIQITSHGPFEIIYVNPRDDPRKKWK
jgi:quercetin dioxygenase-like cupin family protein